jgi:hypothetical protein
VRPRKLALLSAPFLLLTMLPGAAAAAGPSGDASADHAAKVVRYWTPDRVRSAVPRDMVRTAAGFVPRARPGTGGGTTGLANTMGASWSGSEAVFKGTGKVLFTIGGGNYVCSGSVVAENDSSLAVILTAGHCAFENDGRTSATNWMFVPNFDASPTFTCANTALGCWVADELYGRTEFYTAGGFNTTAVQHDWAFAVVRGAAPGKNAGAQLDATVGGGFGLVTTGVATSQVLTALGYPAAQKYNGKDLTYCRNPIGTDAGTGGTTWSMACTMTGGSSGGPWTKTTATSDATYSFGNTTLVGLNSYGYSGVKNMYSPKFNGETQSTFSDALRGAAGSGTVRVLLP